VPREVDRDFDKPAPADAARMPGADTRRQLHLRDGYHCRFCGAPVIRKEVRQRFRALFPALEIWGPKNMDQHAAFQAMWAQYDHVVPHSKGGSNDLENLVVTCAPCNFARMDYSLEQVGLADPRERQPPRSPWNGLEQMLL
jgi:5-methylcytosine-specific restriction endonuclease McrA